MRAVTEDHGSHVSISARFIDEVSAGISTESMRTTDDSFLSLYARKSLFLSNMLNLIIGKTYMLKEEKIEDIKKTLTCNLQGHVERATQEDYDGSFSVPDFFREQIRIMERTGIIHPILYGMSDSFDYYVDKCDDEQDLKAHVVAEQDPNMADYFRSVKRYSFLL